MDVWGYGAGFDLRTYSNGEDMTKQYMTFVVEFEGETPRIGFGDEIFGGRITAMSCYDSISAEEILQDAIDQSDFYDEKVQEASKKVNRMAFDALKNRKQGEV